MSPGTLAGFLGWLHRNLQREGGGSSFLLIANIPPQTLPEHPRNKSHRSQRQSGVLSPAFRTLLPWEGAGGGVAKTKGTWEKWDKSHSGTGEALWAGGGQASLH